MKREDVGKDSSRLIIYSWNEKDKFSMEFTSGGSDKETMDKYHELLEGYKDGGWPEKGYHLMLVREEMNHFVLEEI